jgi:hypothetical protein
VIDVKFFAALAVTDDGAKFEALEKALREHLADLRGYRVARPSWTCTSSGGPPRSSGWASTPPRSRPDDRGLAASGRRKMPKQRGT